MDQAYLKCSISVVNFSQIGTAIIPSEKRILLYILNFVGFILPFSHVVWIRIWETADAWYSSQHFFYSTLFLLSSIESFIYKTAQRRHFNIYKHSLLGVAGIFYQNIIWDMHTEERLSWKMIKYIHAMQTLYVNTKCIWNANVVHTEIHYLCLAEY